MRASEILLEYRRDITARNYGEKLLVRLANHSLNGLPHYLWDYRKLLQLVKIKAKSGGIVSMTANLIPTTWKLDTPQGPVTVTPDNIDEIYQSVKPDIIDHILMAIEEHDPTQNKQYTQWLIRMLINTTETGGSINLEDLNRNDMLLAYDIAKRRNLLKPEHRDINKFTTYRQFERTMNTQYRIDEILNTEEVGRGASKKVYEDSTVTVYIPLDARAARSLGCNTVWCTRGEDQYNAYTKSGPLYILLPKIQEISDEVMKYQIHLPSAQFMDPDDEPVDPGMLAERFPGFFDWLIQNDPDAKNNTILIGDEMLTKLWGALANTMKILYKDRIVELSYHDETYMDQLSAAGALDVDGSIDDEVVERENLQYWQVDSDVNKNLKYLDRMFRFKPTDIREWIQWSTAHDDSTLSEIQRLPDVFLHAMEENQYMDNENIFFDIATELYVNPISDRKKLMRDTGARGQRPQRVETVGPYEVGYYDKLPGAFGE